VLSWFTLPKANQMSDVLAFLDAFKKERDFKAAFPLLINDERFRNELFSQIATNVYPYAEYASWLAQHFFEAYPSYFGTWVGPFKQILFATENHTVQRNLIHIFIFNKAPLEEDGEFLERLIGFVRSTDSLPALKVNAFKAIETQYLGAYPELITEMQLLMELHREDSRPSVQSLIRYFHNRYSRQLNAATL
jgi:hypothetical protein